MCVSIHIFKKKIERLKWGYGDCPGALEKDLWQTLTSIVRGLSYPDVEIDAVMLF